MSRGPTRVVFFSNTSWYLFNFRLRVLQAALQDNRVDEVICFCGDTKYAQALEQEGCIFVFTPLRSQQRIALLPFDLLRVLLLVFRYKPETIFTFTPLVSVLVGIARRFFTFRFVPNISGLGRGAALPKLVRSAFLRLLAFAIDRADHVFFQNESDFAKLSHFRPNHCWSYEVHPGSGVDLERFKPGDAEKSSARKFLFASRLLVLKGIREFLQMAAVMRSERTDLEFWVSGALGKGDHYISEKELLEADSDGIISYLGFRSDIDALLQVADCVVLPSGYPEGTPKILIEAAASGLPIITSNSPGCEDVVANGNGLICSPLEVTSLVGAVRTMSELDEPTYREMRRRSRQLAEEKFCDSQVSLSYLNNLVTS